MVKLKVQHNFNGLFILYYFFCQSEWRSGDFRSLLNYLEFSLASAHSNTFIPGKIYFSDLKEQGQVLLQFIGTFLRVLVINHILCIWPFILSCGCTFSLCEEDWILPWPVRNWVVFHSSFAVFFFFFWPVCILAVPQNKDSLSVYLQQAQFCLHLFPWLHSHICPQPAEYPAVCLVLLLLPAERSGLDLDWCQAVCAGWSAPHVQLVPRPCFIIEYIYDERTSEMTFYKSSHSGTAV